jgi:hypothetical protein
VKLVVCTPSLGSVSLGYRDSYRILSHLCDERGITLTVFDDTNRGHLRDARNCLLYRISQELDDEDRALWWDSDVSFDPALALELWARKERLIARAYLVPVPSFDEQPPAPVWSVDLHRSGGGWGNKGFSWSEDKQLVKADCVGFGCVMMRPSLARDMREKLGVFGQGDEKPRIQGFSELEDERQRVTGEDGAFCFRMGALLDEKPWVAPWGYLDNRGAVGCYLDHLAAGIGLEGGDVNVLRVAMETEARR